MHIDTHGTPDTVTHTHSHTQAFRLGSCSSQVSTMPLETGRFLDFRLFDNEPALPHTCAGQIQVWKPAKYGHGHLWELHKLAKALVVGIVLKSCNTYTTCIIEPRTNINICTST